MNITVNHIPFSTAHNRRPNIKMTPTAITVHSTGNKNSTARNERAWLENPSNKRQASWHYAVDENDIIEAIPPNYVAWHAGDGNGDGNMKSISIEMCESGNRELVLKRTQDLVRYLMDKHNIRKVVRHYDWTKKNCPRILNSDGKWTDWFQFLGEIYQPKTVEKKVEKLFEPNSPTLKKAAEYVLYRMELEGDLTATWRQKLLAGTLTESEALGLLFVAVERGFIHNKYSNK